MIRFADISDIPALARVHVASWQAAYRYILPDEILSNLSFEQFESNWKRNFNDTQRVNLVIEVDTEVKGFLSFGSSRDDDTTTMTAEIYGLYVVPELWGEGYGRELWTEAAQHLQGKFSEATLWVLQNNTRARRFYERIGFAYDAQVKNISLCGVELPEVRYRKQF